MVLKLRFSFAAVQPAQGCSTSWGAFYLRTHCVGRFGELKRSRLPRSARLSLHPLVPKGQCSFTSEHEHCPPQIGHTVELLSLICNRFS